MSRWILIGGAGLTGLKIAEDLINRNSPNSKIIIADLKDSLDKNEAASKTQDEIEENLTEFDKRLALDYQLQRAVDLIQGVSLYQDTLK